MRSIFSRLARAAAFGAAAFAILMCLAVPAPALQDADIMGKWIFLWEGAMDNYTGTLNVTRKTGNSVFRGSLIVRPATGGTIEEDATITVTGNDVQIECSNPRHVPPKNPETWNADHFFLNIVGQRMEGYTVDSGGARGSNIKFKRGG